MLDFNEVKDRVFMIEICEEVDKNIKLILKVSGESQFAVTNKLNNTSQYFFQNQLLEAVDYYNKINNTEFKEYLKLKDKYSKYDNLINKQ